MSVTAAVVPVDVVLDAVDRLLHMPGPVLKTVCKSLNIQPREAKGVTGGTKPSAKDITMLILQRQCAAWATPVQAAQSGSICRDLLSAPRRAPLDGHLVEVHVEPAMPNNR